METVRDHLNPGGAFAMYNYYRETCFERYANTMSEVFGHDPCFDAVDQTLGPREQAVADRGKGATDSTARRRSGRGRRAAPPTDDHPFPYLRGRSIPTFYLVPGADPAGAPS